MTREVVLAGAEPRLGVSPSSGSRIAVFTPASRATVRRVGARRASRRRPSSHPTSRTSSMSASRSSRARLGLRREARERELLEPVALREIAERGMARHDLVRVDSGRGRAAYSASSRRSFGSRARRQPLGRLQRGADRGDDLRRSGAGSSQTCGSVLRPRAGARAADRSEIERRPRRLRPHSSSAGWKPSPEVEDEVGVADRLDIASARARGRAARHRPA